MRCQCSYKQALIAKLLPEHDLITSKIIGEALHKGHRAQYGLSHSTVACLDRLEVKLADEMRDIGGVCFRFSSVGGVNTTQRVAD